MSSRDRMAIELQTKCYELKLKKLGDRVRDPGFWTGLAPELSITERPLATPIVTAALGPEELERYRHDLEAEGYVHTPPLFDDDELARFRRGIRAVVDADLPPVFACVFDELYRLFARLDPLVSALVGAGYRMVPEGFWSFFVEPGDAGEGPWAATGPHRDSLGPDPAILAGHPPTLINVWIALTDAVPPSSCIYTVPAPYDPAYRTADRAVHPEQIRLQDIRALPTPAGSVLAWSSHLLHWGSRGAPSLTEPRMSVAMYFQSRAAPAFDRSARDPHEPISLDRRLHWIARAIRHPPLFDFPEPAQPSRLVPEA